MQCQGALDCSQYLILIFESCLHFDGLRERAGVCWGRMMKRSNGLFCSNETTFANGKAFLMKFIRFSQWVEFWKLEA